MCFVIIQNVQIDCIVMHCIVLYFYVTLLITLKKKKNMMVVN